MGCSESFNILHNLLLNAKDESKLELAKKIELANKNRVDIPETDELYIYPINDVNNTDCKNILSICGFIFINASKFASSLIENFGTLNVLCMLEMFGEVDDTVEYLKNKKSKKIDKRLH